ncbi:MULTISPECIES: Eco29kI family restriction endonuclease [Burkholderia]|uniref:Eco29kI family restriction endonuclease n=1 Tax=Burkholderia TaxID=32008 RepID=UPI0009EAE465|nr:MULTISPECIES: Eco29kI family restriction endonuclease [Burkholderia]MBO2971051.1 Eco29kI family restriction endonuclease [Burkholderia pseudomallei]MBO3055385.1 Eco29kI family restriction endonuclease [Burkholderia pseudomallei]MBO7758254.1 Eco29kI family restriction endonuclease [Burkholderia pseudomallei]MBO7775591.1 Eco29kI family restriction endonuclease [Burkholderia pseudomallei]MBO7819714.1 Eco29kI family restriction endonuclease [Burkholderia pseudomallei]
MTDSTGNIIPFNPLDKKNLGASVAEAMLEQKPQPLGELKQFFGVGIYAIYYVGDFEAYAPLAKRNRNEAFQAPIYVGKAVPRGARKGGGVGEVRSKALYDRLREHAESVQLATNLDIKDFLCRFLVVDDIWIPLGESLLIAKFAPLWNASIDGFGNHDPGSGRYNGMRPRWDVLHPGRAWAEKCRAREETREQVIRDVHNYFATFSFPASHHLLGPDQQP